MNPIRGFRAHKVPYILERVREAKSILHVGCTNSPRTALRWQHDSLLHKTLCEIRPGAVTGIDIDQEAVDWLAARLPNERVVFGDAHDLTGVFPGETFDLIIAGDMIEHLPNPGKFVEAAGRALTPRGVLLITTANAFGGVRFLKAVAGHEAVHDEHTAYFSHSTLRRLAAMSGLRVAAAGYYCAEPEMKNRGLNGRISYALEAAITPLFPQYSEGVIAELVRAS